LPLLLLAAVLALGCSIRLVGLDRAPLRNDELNHYYVARALQRGDHPVLPSGEWYVRGLDYTRAASISLDHVTPIERAVRLPSALFGCAGLVLFAILVWSMAGPWPAVYATLLFALYPQLIYQSRSGRFYTLQFLFGLIAFYAGWRALSGTKKPGNAHQRFLHDWGWTALTIAGFALAARVQVVSLSGMAAWGVAVLAVAYAHTRSCGRSALRWSVPLQLTVLGITAGVLLLATRPDAASQMLVRAISIPYWARTTGLQDANYVGLIATNQPVLVFTGALALYWVTRRRRALGLYLLAWFGVPLMLQSMLPWKHERFILLALPALFVAVAIAATELLATVHRFIHEHVARRRLRRPFPALAASTAVIVIALGVLRPTPAFTRAVWPFVRRPVTGWNETLAKARALPGGQHIPIAHSLPLPALHYWGRLDFTINEGAREQWLTSERKQESLGVVEPGGYVMLPQGSPDMYTGAPVLSTPAAIRARYQSAGAVLIGIDARTMQFDGVRSDLYQTLQLEAEELCQGRCGPMLLFHWRFGVDEDPEEG
jgi:hypothetical protein